MDIVIFILASSIFVISNVIGLAVSPIASVFTLIVVFLVAAFYVWIISLPFFALIFIIIYVGAIAVLFLFVVIMIDQKNIELSQEEHFGSPIVSVASFFMIFWPTISLYLFNIVGYMDDSSMVADDSQDIEAIINDVRRLLFKNMFDAGYDAQIFGQVLYNYYLIYVLLAGLMLLVAVIGAIVLTLEFNSNSTRPQIIDKQLSRKENFLSFRK